jgi:hypothetical protein
MKKIDPTHWSTIGLVAQGGLKLPSLGTLPLNLTLLIGALALFMCLSLLLLFPFSSCLALPHVLHHQYQDLGARSHDKVVSNNSSYKELCKIDDV